MQSPAHQYRAAFAYQSMQRKRGSLLLLQTQPLSRQHDHYHTVTDQRSGHVDQRRASHTASGSAAHHQRPVFFYFPRSHPTYDFLIIQHALHKHNLLEVIGLGKESGRNRNRPIKTQRALPIPSSGRGITSFFLSFYNMHSKTTTLTGLLPLLKNSTRYLHRKFCRFSAQ